MDTSQSTPQPTARTRALAYLRVSGRGQIDRDGFPRQRETVERYARSHSVKIVGEYLDRGVSGTRDLDDRQGLSDLIARVRSNGVGLVLVERADRLARSLLVSEILLAQFRDLGVRVIAADGGTDLTAADEDPTRVLIRQVLGAVAEFEKSVIVAKLRAARVRKRRATGRCEGRKPFGVRPGEPAIVARIRQLRRKPRGGKRATFAEIAERLNTEGLPTRTGSQWRAGTVHRIVRRLKLETVTSPSAGSGYAVQGEPSESQRSTRGMGPQLPFSVLAQPLGTDLADLHNREAARL